MLVKNMECLSMAGLGYPVNNNQTSVNGENIQPIFLAFQCKCQLPWERVIKQYYKMTSDLSMVLSNQNGDFVRHVSFHRKKNICRSVSPALNVQVPIDTLGGEHKVPCLRTQHSDPARAQTQTAWYAVQCMNTTH